MDVTCRYFCLGREKLLELAFRVWQKIRLAMGRKDTWKLSPSQQKEMNGAIVMAQEAMDQVSGVWAGAVPASALTGSYSKQALKISSRLFFAF